jgi:ubiquitin-protein ligase E3 C
LDHSAPRISKRHMAYISPRLGVLNNIPFAIPFDVRVAIFRTFVFNDQRRLGVNDHYSRSRRTRVAVRRDKIAQDGFDHLQEADLKGEVQITFIDQFGNEECVVHIFLLSLD